MIKSLLREQFTRESCFAPVMSFPANAVLWLTAAPGQNDVQVSDVSDMRVSRKLRKFPQRLQLFFYSVPGGLQY